ncbi:MAG: hypothetical protein NWR36_05000, partial [Opitutales bacterium]|nr:hypothetical protein [Opitutales bacterium]
EIVRGLLSLRIGLDELADAVPDERDQRDTRRRDGNADVRERQPELATANTDQLLATVLPELQSLIGMAGKPTFVHHTHWDQAIAQYKLGYGKVLEAIDQIEATAPGLCLTGNYRTGISVSYCIEAALNHDL